MIFKKKKEIKIDKSDIYKRNIEYRVRTLGGINYCFGEEVCYELNEVANLVWEGINGFDSVETIIEDIAKEYNVEPSEIENDIISFIGEMVANGVYIKTNE